MTELLDVMVIRDPRTKTDWSRTERLGPGPRTEPDQNRKKTKKSRKSSDQDREKFQNFGPDQGQQNFSSNKISSNKISYRFGPCGTWIPDGNRIPTLHLNPNIVLIVSNVTVRLKCWISFLHRVPPGHFLKIGRGGQTLPTRWRRCALFGFTKTAKNG